MAVTEFSSLPIHQSIKDAITKSFHYTRMTPVQVATIPIFLNNKDVCVQAVTGSGKTFAFLIPLLHYSLKQFDQLDEDIKKFNQKVHSIVISPTRELANQTYDVLTQLTNESPISPILLVGGCSVHADESAFIKNGANIIIATPGRLADLLQRCTPLLKSIRENLNFFILDEADLILDLGFQKTLGDILKKLPKQRRTGLFSATQTKQLEHLVRAGLRDPVKIEIKAKANLSIEKKSLKNIQDSNVHVVNVDSKCRSSKIAKHASVQNSQLEDDHKGSIDSGETTTLVSTTCTSSDIPIVTDVTISPSLTNYYIVVDSYAEKLAFTINFIASNSIANSSFKAIIFLATCAQVDYFHKLFTFNLEKGQVNSKNSNSKKKKSNSKNVALAEESVNSVKIFKLHRKLNKKRSKIFKSFTSEKCSSIMIATDIIARGIDVKNLDWVVHLDLPNSLQDYVHRSGRSGHMIGHKGMSLLLVLPHEIPYVTLCGRKNIPLEKYEAKYCKNVVCPDSNNVVNWMKSEARKSFAFYQESICAFVSFIRTYSSKNILSGTIFPSLDIISLVNSFGLLKIPNMPELKGRLKKEQISQYSNEQDILLVKNYEKMAKEKKYKSTKKEEEQDDGDLQCIKSHEERRMKISRKINSTSLTGKRKKELIDQLELQELQEDARMVKKVKRGKISEEAFDRHFGL